MEQPDIVKQYNSNMGGVDRMDQNLGHCRTTVGGKKWYWLIITWCFDACVQNAWQLHRKTGHNLSITEFRRDLTCVLLRESAGRRKSGVGRLNRAGDDQLCYDNKGHYLIVKRNVRA